MRLVGMVDAVIMKLGPATAAIPGFLNLPGAPTLTRIDLEPHVDPPRETRRCVVCGVPLEPTEPSFCAAHRRQEGERDGPGRHHLTEVLLLGFFLLAAILAVLLVFA